MVRTEQRGSLTPFRAIRRRFTVVHWDHHQARNEPGCSAAPMKRCAGLADRSCRKKVLPRRKRCATCSKENRRQQRSGYNQRYFQANREPLNEKRRERRRKARARRAVEPIVEWMKEEAKRRAALPRLVGRSWRTAPLARPRHGEVRVPVLNPTSPVLSRRHFGTFSLAIAAKSLVARSIIQLRPRWRRVGVSPQKPWVCVPRVVARA